MAIGLVVVVDGVLRHLKSDYGVKFSILDCGLTSDQQRRIEQVITKSGRGRVEWHNVRESLAAINFPLKDHFTVATYGRLLLPNLLSEKKTIYLDCDLIVRRDLSLLWQHDLEGTLIGAVADVGEYRIEEAYPLAKKLAANSSDLVFNGGVLLMDLDRMRQDGSVDQLLSYVQMYADTIVHVDQEVLNVIFSGRRKLIEMEWNFMISAWMSKARALLPAYLQKPSFQHPLVYHLTGSYKPWNGGIRHPALLPFLSELWNSRYMRGMDWLRVMPRMILPPKVQSWLGLSK